MSESQIELDLAGYSIAKENTIQAKFMSFHEKNPHIYDSLVDMAMQLKRTGKKKIGMSMLWEVLRWNYLINTQGDEEYKLNNNYKSRYTRKIMEENRMLDGMFDIREIKRP